MTKEEKKEKEGHPLARHTLKKEENWYDRPDCVYYYSGGLGVDQLN